MWFYLKQLKNTNNERYWKKVSKRMRLAGLANNRMKFAALPSFMHKLMEFWK